MSQDSPFSRRRKDLTSREKTDLRPPFAIDCDRILHSLAYTRYIDKTQVFYLLRNDHVTHRVLHVQLVSRIARTIGQKLGLDLDLIEAAALGHDLGHVPFGHDGEHFLAELCKEHHIGGKSGFSHAVMSLRFLERLEKHGRGLNLTLGVLDAILCHDGESDFSQISPNGEPTFAELDRRIELRTESPSAFVAPMTGEGCVVRLSDSISYVGRDLEDAVRLGIVDRARIPQEVAEIIGSTNGTIVYKLVEDLLRNTKTKEGIYGFSKTVGNALISLKNFNREHIYYNPLVKRDSDKIKMLFRYFFETFTSDFERINGPQNLRLRHFVEQMDEAYVKDTLPAEKARDFIAGMTDDFFCNMAKELLIPTVNSDLFKMDL
ncbi:MAG: HD domain-containing protein [Deltaproteobacteria bacterium]|jgi:dGTPase|nr:HD domain-containing protein [Deltaproteobacteria bacterium]